MKVREGAYTPAHQKSISVMDRPPQTAHTPVSGGQDLAIKKMETEMTKQTAPGSTMHGTPSRRGETRFNDRRSTHMPSNDYASMDNSPLKVDGRGGNLAMKQTLGDHYRRAALNSRDGAAHKRSQSVQRNGQLAAMAKTAPQGGFFKPTTAGGMPPQTAIATPKGFAEQ